MSEPCGKDDSCPLLDKDELLRIFKQALDQTIDESREEGVWHLYEGDEPDLNMLATLSTGLMGTSERTELLNHLAACPYCMAHFLDDYGQEGALDLPEGDTFFQELGSKLFPDEEDDE